MMRRIAAGLAAVSLAALSAGAAQAETPTATAMIDGYRVQTFGD